MSLKWQNLSPMGLLPRWRMRYDPVPGIKVLCVNVYFFLCKCTMCSEAFLTELFKWLIFNDHFILFM